VLVAFSAGDKRKRLFIVWIIAVATCAVTVLAQLILRPLHIRTVGLDVSSVLTVGMYVTTAAMCLVTLRWFLTTPKTARRITVQELRRRGSAAHSSPR
jgi:uncharacterized membrane protein YczE